MHRRILFLLLLSWAASARAAERTLDIREFGAVSGGTQLCTQAIQKAIDACAAGGGGTVRFPPGTYLSGALTMRSGVTLYIEEGATLLGSTKHEDYYPHPDVAGAPGPGKSGFRNLIHGENLDRVAIRGPGMIDGNGAAFRDKTRPRPKNIYLAHCRDVTIEDVRLRSAGCWMQHYRLCENVILRNIHVFNHVAYNNDGLNIDSCSHVTITGCRVDSDDDGIVLKSLSDRPCRNVLVADCTVSSHCNALKMGTESGGGFVDITVRRCTVFSPRESQQIYGRQRGLAAIALEIVDGGRLDNVRVSDVDIDGVSVPVFLRLGNRARVYGEGKKPGIGTFRNVHLENIRAKNTSLIGCSITGLAGHPIENVTLRNVDLGFEGGGSAADAARMIPERESSYPESTMFGTLPAYGFYCRHARGLRFVNVRLATAQPDLRPAMVFDDVEDIELDGLQAPHSPGAPAMIRMVQVRGAEIRRSGPLSPAEVLLRVEGDKAGRIRLTDVDARHVRRLVETAPDVRPGAVSQAEPESPKNR